MNIEQQNEWDRIKGLILGFCVALIVILTAVAGYNDWRKNTKAEARERVEAVVPTSCDDTQVASGVLHVGSVGPMVYEVEGLLQQQVATDLLWDRTYGGRTEDAVKKFQQTNGLPVTGKVDAKTMKALCGIAPQSASAETGLANTL